MWTGDFESFQDAKFNTFILFYSDVQVCHGAAMEHRSLLNISSVCEANNFCNILFLFIPPF